MGDREAGSDQRVTALELFFDLVVVFAITQVTGFLSHDPTWGGLLRGLLVLCAVWWLWSAYAWLTNALNPEVGGVRLSMFGALVAMIIIIALGESIVAIGGGSGGQLDAGVIWAALLGMTVIASLWWSYFDWVAFVAQARLTEATGRERAALARDLYSYLHLPMVAGIV